MDIESLEEFPKNFYVENSEAIPKEISIVEFLEEFLKQFLVEFQEESIDIYVKEFL